MGRRFGRYTVLAFVGMRGDESVWLVVCDCGTVKELQRQCITSSKRLVPNCGCLTKEKAIHRGTKNNPNFKHGHRRAAIRSREYNSWRGMRGRCLYSKHIAFPDYGGRGITVCDRWKYFANFLMDMGPRPEKTSIDRINPDGNYEPSNCRWATAAQQQANKRVKVLTEAK